MLIVFDLMGTLVTDPYRAAHEAASGATFEEFLRLDPEDVYHRLERGEIPEEEYWRVLRERGMPFDVELFHTVRVQGYHWLDGMRELALECAGAHRTVVGSNYPEWVRDVEAGFFATAGIEVFASCRLGVRKPAHAFFAALCERTGTRPEELVLVDDKARNTDAANSFGARGIHFTSASRTRRELQSAGVLPETAVPPLAVRVPGQPESVCPGEA